MKVLKLNKTEKFIMLISILILYTVVMITKYGWSNGPLVSLTTWSFFVFCTPIADAGFLIDFPVRVLTGIKMFHSEIIVWIVASLITTFSLLYNVDIFKDTGILNIYYHILKHLNPYGIIIFLSAIGTFLSIRLGDEIYDKISKKNTKKVKLMKYVLFFALIIIVIIIYYFIIRQFNLKISLF